MSASNPVLIAGAGIGGLSAALSLAQVGQDVILFEKTEELQEVGAGLQLSPNACNILEGFGILGDLKKTGFAPDAVHIRDGRSGQLYADVPLGRSLLARYRSPYLVLHRADLQKALYKKAMAHPKIQILLGREFRGIEENSHAKVVIRVGHDDKEETLRGRALIGADGVWSKVRETIPASASAAFTGKVSYRATIPAYQVPDELLRGTGLWLGNNAHVVHYPLREATQFNIVALIDEDWAEKTWSAPADQDALLARFTHWTPMLRNLMALPDTWLKWALCGVPANNNWVDKRVALLGDAAHAMLPFVAQGACMAIEDAAVLAGFLSPRTRDVPASLLAYERNRKDRVVKIQKTAEKNGRIYHMTGPMAFARNTVLRMSSEKKLADRMDWIYGWRPMI